VDLFLIHAEGIEDTLASYKAQGKEGVYVPANLVIASWWYRTDPEVPERTTARMRKINPLGVEVAVTEFSVDLKTQSGSRTFFKIPQFALSDFGRYFFIIEAKMTSEKEAPDWREVARLPLDVRVARPPDDTDKPGPPSETSPSAASS
jgi:hypothetical protein